MKPIRRLTGTLSAGVTLLALAFTAAPAHADSATPATPGSAPVRIASPGKTTLLPRAPQHLTPASTTYGPYLVKNVVTGKCIDIPGYGPGTVNGPVNEYTCDGSSRDNQLFYWDYLGDSSNGYRLYNLRNVKDNLCLDVPNYGSVSAGTKVSEFYCNQTTGDNQIYGQVPRSDGSFWLVNLASGLCLDVDGVRTGGNDARLTLYYCSDNDDHHWTIP
ncbi:RICIN domain-containing protein [Streptomyces sp. NPDC059070]|uniref:RICIN domain-containing protein n=1 Tax=unclassified Streptomyces TaxID=2593676 RepID=UPI0034E2013C